MKRASWPRRRSRVMEKRSTPLGQVIPLPLAHRVDPLLTRQDVADLLADDDLIRPALEQALLHSERRILGLEEERRRMSRDLHDGVLQSLYAVGLRLRASLLVARETPEHTVPHIEHAVQHLTEATEEIRAFLTRHGAQQHIEPRDFEPALRRLLERVFAGSPIEWHVNVDAFAPLLLSKRDVREVLHIVREAVSNCVRHAHATRFTVAVEARNRAFHLAVRDNGRGFDVHGPASGFGLHNMVDRAEAMDGTLQITSSLEQGTLIELDVPSRV